jgi:hypothetical protein
MVSISRGIRIRLICAGLSICRGCLGDRRTRDEGNLESGQQGDYWRAGMRFPRVALDVDLECHPLAMI